MDLLNITNRGQICDFRGNFYQLSQSFQICGLISLLFHQNHEKNHRKIVCWGAPYFLPGVSAFSSRKIFQHFSENLKIVLT